MKRTDLTSGPVAPGLLRFAFPLLLGTLVQQLRAIRSDPPLLKKTVAIGLPAGAQALVITLSNVVVQAHINSFGADAIAAFPPVDAGDDDGGHKPERHHRHRRAEPEKRDLFRHAVHLPPPP